MKNARRYALTAGALSNLKLQEFQLPEPGTHEVSIEVKAIGLNFADIFAIWGLYGATPKGEFTPGLEFSGIVEKVGSGVENLRPGDRVMGVSRFGAYTSHLNLDARYLVRLPENWDFKTGAAYLVQTLTAYYGLFNLGNLQRGQTVLIHSVAGGVGLQALKIAKSLDCFVVGTIGNAGKIELARQEGCDRVIVRGQDFENQLVASLEGRPLHLVMDSVGGQFFKIPLKKLAPEGKMVVFGSARYASVGDRPNYLKMLYHFWTRPKIDPQKMVERNQAVMGFNLIWLYNNVERMHEMLPKIEALDLRPPHVGHVFPFEKMLEAIRLFQTGKTVGKVVVEV